MENRISSEQIQKNYEQYLSEARPYIEHLSYLKNLKAIKYLFNMRTKEFKPLENEDGPGEIEIKEHLIKLRIKYNLILIQ